MSNVELTNVQAARDLKVKQVVKARLVPPVFGVARGVPALVVILIIVIAAAYREMTSHPGTQIALLAVVAFCGPVIFAACVAARSYRGWTRRWRAGVIGTCAGLALVSALVLLLHAQAGLRAKALLALGRVDAAAELLPDLLARDDHSVAYAVANAYRKLDRTEDRTKVLEALLLHEQQTHTGAAESLALNIELALIYLDQIEWEEARDIRARTAHRLNAGHIALDQPASLMMSALHLAAGPATINRRRDVSNQFEELASRLNVNARQPDPRAVFVYHFARARAERLMNEHIAEDSEDSLAIARKAADLIGDNHLRDKVLTLSVRETLALADATAVKLAWGDVLEPETVQRTRESVAQLHDPVYAAFADLAYADYLARAKRSSSNEDLNSALEEEIHKRVKATRMAGTEAQLYRRIGELYITAQHPTFALEFLSRAEAALPSSLEVQYSLGRVLAVRRRCADAMPRFEKLIRTDPKDLAAVNQLAACKLDMGDYDGAERVLADADLTTELDAQSQYLRARVLFRPETKPDAIIANMEAVLEYLPSSDSVEADDTEPEFGNLRDLIETTRCEAINALAYQYTLIRKLRLAAMYSRSTSCEDNKEVQAYWLDTKGWLLVRSIEAHELPYNRIWEARDLFVQSLEAASALSSDDYSAQLQAQHVEATARYHIGYVDARMGYKAEATESFRLALGAEASLQDAKLALENPPRPYRTKAAHRNDRSNPLPASNESPTVALTKSQ